MQVGIYVCMSVCLSCCLSVWRVDTMGGVGGQRTGPYTYIYIYTYMHIHISICLCSLMVQACLHPSWHSTSQRAAPKASCWEAHQPSKQMTWGSVKLISAVGQCKPQNLTVVPNSGVWRLSMLSHPKMRWARSPSAAQDGSKQLDPSLTGRRVSTWKSCPQLSFHLKVEGPKDWQRPSRSLEVSNLCLRSAQPSFWSLNFAKVVVANPGNLGGLESWTLDV